MRLFAVIGGFLVLVLVAALAVPALIDWSSFRADFEREASRVLGHPVTVSGSTSARLLPWPKVDFEAVTIGEREDGLPLLTLDRIAFDVEIAPLLRGDVRVVEMQLDRPTGRLVIGRDGGLDWLRRSERSRIVVAPADISIERLSVRDGAITVSDARRVGDVEITRLDVDLTADSLAGPWRGEGAFDFRGERFDVSGTTGSLRREAGTARLPARLTLEPRSLAYRLTATGPVTIDGSDARFDGSFSVEPRAVEDDEDEAPPVFVDGAMRLDRTKLELPAFIVRVGEGDDPYRLDGTAEAFFEGRERYALRLRGSQVDADRLPAATAAGEAVGLERRVAALGDVLRRIPLPSVPGDVRLELPALVAGDTIVRELSADIRPLGDGTGWDVRRFSATLPGRTTLEASGRLAVPRREGDGLGFEGRMLMASRQPSGFAAWLVADVDDAIRQLGSAGFQADVKLGGESARFDDLELRLGQEVLRGTLARVAAAGDAKARILANLNGTRLDARTLRGLFELFVGEGANADALAHDLDLRLEVDAAQAFGTVARGIDLVALYENGDLAIDRLAIERVEGVAVDMTGSIASLYDRPSGRIGGTVELEDPAAAMAALKRRDLLPPLAAHLAEQPALLEGTRIDLTLDARRAGLETLTTLAVDGTVGTSTLTATARYEGEPGAKDPRIALEALATNEEPVALLRQVGLSPRAASLPGPGEISIGIGGRPSALDVTAAATIGESRAATKGATRYVEGQGDLYEGTFEIEAADLDPLLRGFAIRAPGVGEGTPVSLAGTIVADAGRIGVDAVKGKVRGTGVAASLVLDTDTDPRPRIDGTLDLGTFDLTSLVQMVLGPQVDAAALAGGDAGGFGTPLLAGLDGDLLLKADRATLDLDLLPAKAAERFTAETAINDGNVELDLSARQWLGGRLSGTVTVAKVGRNGVVGTDLELNDADVAATGLVDAGSPRLSGRFDLTLAAQAQAETARGIAEGLAGGANLKLRDARLRGLRPDALATILPAADAVEDAALEGAAPALAERAIVEGAARLPDVEVPLTIANGVARATGIALDLDGASASADLRLDIAGARADGTVQGTFDVPRGAEEVKGVNPDFRIDFEATPGAQSAALDATALTTYLTTRLRERREREFEAQRAAILERQRLVRAMRLSREREKRALDAQRARAERTVPG